MLNNDIFQFLLYFLFQSFPLMVIRNSVNFGFKLHNSTYLTSYSIFCVVVVDFVVEVIEDVVVFIGFRMG